MMSSPQHPGGASFEPRLVSDTRKALAVLYSFPTAATTTRAAAGGRPLTPHEAHDFLLNMQSKNVRRRIQSLGQRQRDHRDPQQAHASLQEERLPMGSTWLACLAILCHSQSFTAQSTTEQLFCAQTLLHRLRRIRLVEAIDWELEQPTAESSYFQAFAIYESNLVDSLVPFYISLIHSIHPIIGSVLAAHSAASSSSSSSYTEERAKGELSVMTIASLIYLTVLSGYHDSQTIPLLSTLSAALATIVLRLRFVNNEGQQQDGTTTTNATCPPMVDSIIQAFHSVHHILSTRVGGASSSSSAPFLSSLQTCLSVLPDTVLGSPGGARGRLSMDPRGIQAATVELCTMGLATLQETLRQYQQYASTGLEEQLVDYWVLCICLEWAKYVPLSTDFVQQIAPLMNKHLTVNETRHQKVVTALMIALFEGAALPESELLARRVGLSDSQLPSPPQKKRQTSRSKQRKMGLIESSMTNEMLEEIQQEARMRGESACIVALFTWDNFSAATNHALTACSDNPTATVQGEGPIGCLAAAANACLPFLLKNPGFHHSQDLFFGLAKSFQRLCQSPNKSVRGLAYEPLYTLKESLESLDSRHNGASLGDEINALVVDHFFQCAMSLASACAYPVDYFDDLAGLSDEDLEVERNDVRDILRALTGFQEKDGDCDATVSNEMSLQLLLKILQVCDQALDSARQKNEYFSESMVHAYSSLDASHSEAKPLGQLSKHSTTLFEGVHKEILSLALSILQVTCEMIVSAFERPCSTIQILPLSRITCISIASLAPMLGNVSKCNTFDDMLPRVLALCGQAASCSVVHLPELPAASILGHSIYDIRGSMTGPGGEDHGESVSTLFRIGRREVLLCLSNLSSLWTKVACVALKRLVSEGSELSARLIGSSSDIIPHLCHVHRGLKLIETERGQGVHYGRGVTPKSRRMLLACICDLETAAGGQGGASPMLYQLFEDTVRMVASFKSRVQQLSDKDVFACCEAVLDLGSFPSSAICSLFAKQPNEPSTMTECLEVLNAIGVQGYRRISTGDQGDSRNSAWLMQWNRLRAALFFLFKHSASPDLAPIACAMIQTLVTAECEAVHRQCMAGPSSSSSLFQDELVSSEFVPAGLFIRVVGEVVMCARRKSQTCSTLAGCFSTICELSDPVLSSICHPCSEPHSGAFADPRPTIIEAWLFTLVELLTSFDFALPGSQLERTVTETFIAVLTLLFNPSMGKTSEERALDKGPSLDGPQSLALMAFVTSFFERGASLLETVSNRLLHTMPVAFDSDAGGPGHRGAAIIVAAILRAIQGALPPWAVESVPEVFSSFYSAIGKDASSFEVILRLSMIVRNNSQEDMGGVKTGSLLSGHYFETMSGQAKTQFVTQAVNLAQKDNASSWRRLKVLVKAACGGKKKETDFGQKPSLTRWDFERV